MHIWKLEHDTGEVEYFKDLDALSTWISCFVPEKIDQFTVERIYVND